MKYTVAIVAIAFLAIAVNAAPPAGQQEAQVVRFDSDVQPESYKFA